jgi:excisionase family DNA binding protein
MPASGWLAKMDNLLSPSQAAKRLGLKPAMVRRHCQYGELKATKVGSRWVIREEDLEAFAAKPRQRGPKTKAPKPR